MQLLLKQSAADSSTAHKDKQVANHASSAIVHPRKEPPATQGGGGGDSAPLKNKRKKIGAERATPETGRAENTGSQGRPPGPEFSRLQGHGGRAAGFGEDNVAGTGGGGGGDGSGGGGSGGGRGLVGVGGAGKNGDIVGSMHNTPSPTPPTGAHMAAVPPASAAAAPTSANYAGARELAVTAVPAAAWRNHRSPSVPPSEWRNQVEAYAAGRGDSLTNAGAPARPSSDSQKEGANESARDGGAFSARAASPTTAAGSAAAQAAAAAAVGQGRLLQRRKREEQQRLHSAGLQKQRGAQQTDQQHMLPQKQQEFQGHERNRHSSAVQPATTSLQALRTAASLVSAPAPPQQTAALHRQSPSTQPFLPQQQQQHYQKPSPSMAASHQAQKSNVTYIHLGSGGGGAAGGQYNTSRRGSPPVVGPGATADLNAEAIDGGRASLLAHSDGGATSARTPSPRSLVHRTAGAERAGTCDARESLRPSGGSSSSISSVGNGGSGVDVGVSTGGGGVGCNRDAPRSDAGGYGSSWTNSQASAIRSQPPWRGAEGHAGLAADGGNHNLTGRLPPEDPSARFAAGGGGGGGRALSASQFGARPPASASGVVLPGFGAIAAGAGVHVHVHRPHSSGSRVCLVAVEET